MTVIDEVTAALTVHERVALLLDEGEPMIEYGALALPEDRELDAPADGVVTVVGTIHGRSAVVVAFDPSADGGSHGAVAQIKTFSMMRVARELRAPVVVLAEGGRPRGGELPQYRRRGGAVAALASLSGRVPVVGVALGEVLATRALLLGVCDVIVATSQARIDLGERPLPEADDRGTVLARAGAVDVLADDEAGAIGSARRYLQLIGRPLAPAPDEDPDTAEALRRIVPDNPRRAIDARKLMRLLCDPGSVLLLREKFGGNTQTALGRIGGRTVGLVASHSMVGAGAVDSQGSDKLARFLSQCDAFGLPIIYLSDVPGLLAGPQAEQTAMNRHSTRPYFAQVHSRNAHLLVAVRRMYGQGMVVMGKGSHISGKTLELAWPSAEFGGMGLGGAAAITASASARRPDDGATEQDIYDDLRRRGTALAFAEDFSLDQLVDPGDTRARLIEAIGRLPVLDVPRQPIRPIGAW
jgi:acetyl-CoA carboxylase carboxyltransferase component